jgi:hypothetical protein
MRRFIVFAALCVCTYGQSQTPPPKQAPGLPARTTPTEYQAHTKIGELTLAAEFKGHSVPTAQGTPLTSEEYIVVEAAVFGGPDARATLNANDFSLRVNGKKQPLPSQPYGLVVGSLKDPEWEPPAPPAKSKTSMTGAGGGGGKDSNEPPAPVKIPIEVQRSMAQRVQKATMPEGDRALPQAGLLFFSYRGKQSGIHSLELLYSGPAGKATLTLQP